VGGKSLLNSVIGQELHGELKNLSSLSNPSLRYDKSHDGFLMEHTPSGGCNENMIALRHTHAISIKIS